MAAPLRTGCIMLAAGRGTRFGADKRKAGLGKENLLVRALSQVPASFTERLVVLRPGDEALAATLPPGWRVLYAREAGLGLAHSLAAAISALGDWDAALVALGDMPTVRGASFEAIASQLDRDSIVVPCFRGQRGNPVGIGSRFFTELRGLSGDKGARVLLSWYPEAVKRVELEDPGVLRDVDTPADLASLRREAFPDELPGG